MSLPIRGASSDAPPGRRTYYARMPEAAYGPSGRHERRSRRAAFEDLAQGLERYLRQKPAPMDNRDRAAVWAAWAIRLASGKVVKPAPDGSEWYVVTRIS